MMSYSMLMQVFLFINLPMLCIVDCSLAVLTFQDSFNNSTLESEVRVEPMDVVDDSWKNHVIIGCTVTVAVEILIVVLMVMYWRQIRWTLRKLACSCEFCRRCCQQRSVQRDAGNNMSTSRDDDNDIDQHSLAVELLADRRHSGDSSDIYNGTAQYIDSYQQQQQQQQQHSSVSDYWQDAVYTQQHTAGPSSAAGVVAGYSMASSPNSTTATSISSLQRRNNYTDESSSDDDNINTTTALLIHKLPVTQTLMHQSNKPVTVHSGLELCRLESDSS